jgi:hypothetical protein
MHLNGRISNNKESILLCMFFSRLTTKMIVEYYFEYTGHMSATNYIKKLCNDKYIVLYTKVDNTWFYRLTPKGFNFIYNKYNNELKIDNIYDSYKMYYSSLPRNIKIVSHTIGIINFIVGFVKYHYCDSVFKYRWSYELRNSFDLIRHDSLVIASDCEYAVEVDNGTMHRSTLIKKLDTIGKIYISNNDELKRELVFYSINKDNYDIRVNHYNIKFADQRKINENLLKYKNSPKELQKIANEVEKLFTDNDTGAVVDFEINKKRTKINQYISASQDMLNCIYNGLTFRFIDNYTYDTVVRNLTYPVFKRISTIRNMLMYKHETKEYKDLSGTYMNNVKLKYGFNFEDVLYIVEDISDGDMSGQFRVDRYKNNIKGIFHLVLIVDKNFVHDSLIYEDRIAVKYLNINNLMYFDQYNEYDEETIL